MPLSRIKASSITDGSIVAADLADGSISIGKLAAGTLDSANSAAVYANGAFAQANTGVTNAATADAKAVTAGSYANSAFGQANTGVTNAATAQTHAAAAFSAANTAQSTASSKQDALVSGTSIKTINSTSLLGSGDITAGASTTYLDIGTYVIAATGTNSADNANGTRSGSSLLRWYGAYNDSGNGIGDSYTNAQSIGASGTWRAMSYGLAPNGRYAWALYVRVS